MIRATWISNFLNVSIVFYALIALTTSRPADALTLTHTPDGYVATLEPGESIRDAWDVIKQARISTGAPRGTQDVIQLGPGTYPITDSRGNQLTHYPYQGSPVAPPLLIRGAGAHATQIYCGLYGGLSPCVSSRYGLVLEDLSLIPGHSFSPRYMLHVTSADLTLRRVRVTGHVFPFTSAVAPFHVHYGNLTLEDSILSGNRVEGQYSEGLITLSAGAPNLTIRRSILADNDTPALLYLGANNQGTLRIEQSTLVENTVQSVFRRSSGSIRTIHISRSILDHTTTERVQLVIEDSFTDPEPQLARDDQGRWVPKILSPVIDALECVEPVDLRGRPTGVVPSYWAPSTTPCDIGAIEAQQSFCMVSSADTVTCDDGEISVAEAEARGCRLIAGLLDCTGGEQAEVTRLDPGESLVVGDAELLMQGDGNLVLYDHGIARWASNTEIGACIGSYAEVTQGDLVVFSDVASGSIPCFSTGVGGHRAVVREGFRGGPARLLIEEVDGTVTWISTTEVAEGQSFVLHGARFRAGHQLTIPGARAVMQTDGNFVLYDTVDGQETALWALGTEVDCAGRDAELRADGSLVVGEPGSTCFGIVGPTSPATVLRLHRTATGTAALSWYDATGERLLSISQPGPSETQCSDFPADSPDGVYSVSDSTGGERQVYCDMTGGGWMLVAKVYRSHHGTSNLSEPDAWWAGGTDPAEALEPGTVDRAAGLGVDAYGAEWLAGLDLDVARFDVIAEDATPFERIADALPGETGTWYKDPSTLATWFSTEDIASTVCDTEDLSCGEQGRLHKTHDGTWFEGMRLPAGGGWIHMRTDGDVWPHFDGVCSYTGDSSAWADDAAGHWGNGLNIWVKKHRRVAKCTDLPTGSPDGVYTMTDDAGVERQVYCDMTGGGWMLVAKVYRSHHGTSSLSEPDDWWTTGTGLTDALDPGTVDRDSGSGVDAYGTEWLAELDLSVARFDLTAEDATPFEHIADASPGETATWYKDASTLATWFSTSDTPTVVCETEDLSCSISGRIHETTNGTWLEGMKLPGGGGWIHMRTDSDVWPAYDGVCSYTGASASWADDAADHWGNGLEIWVK